MFATQSCLRPRRRLLLPLWRTPSRMYASTKALSTSSNSSSRPGMMLRCVVAAGAAGGVFGEVVCREGTPLRRDCRQLLGCHTLGMWRDNAVQCHLQRRHIAFTPKMDASRPEDVLIELNEQIVKLEETTRRLRNNRRYWHLAINKAMVLIQIGDYRKAKDLAQWVTDDVRQVRSNHSFLYYAETTAAIACERLANDLRVNVIEEEKRSDGIDSIEPRIASSATAEIEFARLLSEAKRHQHEAQRIYNMPQHYFMRPGGVSGNARRRAGWEDTDHSSQTESEGMAQHYRQTVKQRKPRRNAGQEWRAYYRGTRGGVRKDRKGVNIARQYDYDVPK